MEDETKPRRRFQFSLTTLITCITVFAVVSAVSVAAPVREKHMFHVILNYNDLGGVFQEQYVSRRATGLEIAGRMMLWGPVAVAAVLSMLWAVNRRRSRSPLRKVTTPCPPPAGST